MTDFKKLAEQTKVKSDARIAAKQQNLASEAATRKSEFVQAVSELNSKVKPLFNEASSCFAETGVPVLIKYNWERGVQPIRPELSFQCHGPAIENSVGGVDMPEGIVVRAQYWEGKIVVALDKDRSNRGVERVAGELPDAIGEAIRRSLEAYYDSLHRIMTRP